MKTKNRITVLALSLFFLFMSGWAVISDTPAYSDSERRVLASLPDFDLEDILSGDYAADFDQYAVERFPARDTWRSISAYTSKLLLKKDHNGIFTAGNHISRLEYPMNTAMLDYALSVMSKVNDKYLKGNPVWLAVIPDKNRYLAEESGHLTMDYNQFSAYMAQGADFAQYIEIADLLDSSSYYCTDLHWRQEKLTGVAKRITDAMGRELNTDYKAKALSQPFYGVYSGQSALHTPPDTLWYLQNKTITEAEVQGASSIYDISKASKKDPYELFLSGNQPLVALKNNRCSSDRRLILFRDSFGSSLAPLLLDAYSEIVLIDLRYIYVDQLEKSVDFSNADVLFLYSTPILNQSTALKG